MSQVQKEVQQTIDELVASGAERGIQVAAFKRGELVVIVAGAPPGTVGSTNLIHVHRIGEEDV